MYEPSRQLIDFHLAGFAHWDGAAVAESISVGDPVSIVPEYDNPFDPQALALYWKQTKIGYVPAVENALFSTMSFYGHGDIFEARITQKDLTAHPERQIRVSVFIKDSRQS